MARSVGSAMVSSGVAGKVSCVEACLRQGEAGVVRQRRVRLGTVRQARLGAVSRGLSGCDKVGYGRHGKACYGGVSSGLTRQAWLVGVRCGWVWQARYGVVRCGLGRRDMVCQDMARLGKSWRGRRG